MTQAKRALLPLLGVAIVAGGFAIYALALADDDNGRAAPAAAAPDATPSAATAISLDAAVTPTFPPGVLSDGPAVKPTVHPGLLQDAQSYAREMGITVEEAIERLQMQVSSPETQSALLAVAPDRLAGTWVEHTPEFRIVIWFTGGPEGLDEAYRIASRSSTPVHIRTDAKHTQDELQSISERARRSIPVEGFRSTNVDTGKGAIVVTIRSSSPAAADPAALAARLEAEYNAPFIVEISDREYVTQPAPVLPPTLATSARASAPPAGTASR